MIEDLTTEKKKMRDAALRMFLHISLKHLTLPPELKPLADKLIASNKTDPVVYGFCLRAALDNVLDTDCLPAEKEALQSLRQAAQIYTDNYPKGLL